MLILSTTQMSSGLPKLGNEVLISDRGNETNLDWKDTELSLGMVLFPPSPNLAAAIVGTKENRDKWLNPTQQTIKDGSIKIL